MPPSSLRLPRAPAQLPRLYGKVGNTGLGIRAPDLEKPRVAWRVLNLSRAGPRGPRDASLGAVGVARPGHTGLGPSPPQRSFHTAFADPVSWHLVAQCGWTLFTDFALHPEAKPGAGHAAGAQKWSPIKRHAAPWRWSLNASLPLRGQGFLEKRRTAGQGGASAQDGPGTSAAPEGEGVLSGQWGREGRGQV